jgi:hypothetical protein
MFSPTQTPSSVRGLKRYAFFVLMIFFAGCETSSPKSSSGAGGSGSSALGRSPPPNVDVTRNQAWRDAEAVASLEPGRLTVIGAGDSMLPVYGENTVLVLQKVPYGNLVAGMNVAYRNDRGAVVLHRLIAKDSGGWRAIGLNNPEEDMTRVTPYNLLGIVYAAFANDAVR